MKGALPGPRRRRTAAQWLMEWAPLVRIYEGRLWRRSLVVTALTRISFERELSLISGAADLHGAESVLDLACGPGLYARRLAPRLPRGLVVGLDLSAPMLRYAARRADAEGLENLHLVQGDAMALPFGDQRFQAANCCGALHLFPDAKRVLREVYRVLEPGGRFSIAAFRRREGRIAERRARLRRRLYGVDAFTPDELASGLEGAGFADVRCLHARGVWLIMCARKKAASPYSYSIS